MNTSLLSAKPLGGEPPEKSFPRGRDDGLKRKQADGLGTSSNVKSPVAGQIITRGNGLPAETRNRMLTRKPSADVDSQTDCRRKDGTGQRTWPSLPLEVRDVESLLFFFFLLFQKNGEGTHWSVRNQPPQHEAPGTCESQQGHINTQLAPKKEPQAHTHIRRIPSVSNDAHQGTPQPKANGTWSNALLTCALNCHGQ